MVIGMVKEIMKATNMNSNIVRAYCNNLGLTYSRIANSLY